MELERHIPLSCGLALGLLLASCGNNDPQAQRETMQSKLDKVEDKMRETAQEANTHEEWVAERNEVLQDLRDLRDNIDTQLAYRDEQLASSPLKAADRRTHEAMKTELQKEKGIVEGLINNVENSTDATWTTVRQETRLASQEVKDWWNRMKENVDRNTAADKDHDGH